MMGWTEWRIDRETNELVAPCGCRLPNTSASVRAISAGHDCVRDQGGE